MRRYKPEAATRSDLPMIGLVQPVMTTLPDRPGQSEPHSRGFLVHQTLRNRSHDLPDDAVRFADFMNRKRDALLKKAAKPHCNTRERGPAITLTRHVIVFRTVHRFGHDSLLRASRTEWNSRHAEPVALIQVLFVSRLYQSISCGLFAAAYIQSILTSYYSAKGSPESTRKWDEKREAPERTDYKDFTATVRARCGKLPFHDRVRRRKPG